MKKTIILIATILATLTTQAQEKQLTQLETSLSDLKEMLEEEGYQTFSFDMSSLLDDNYLISAVVREYAEGKLVKEDNLCIGTNKMMLSDLDEEEQKETLEEGSAIDPEHGVVKHGDRLQIAFMPTNEAEKTRRFLFSLKDMRCLTKVLKLKSVSGGGDEFCFYNVRPFTVHPLKINEFHPLVLLGSSWYDERVKVFRFCGDSEIDPDLSSDILKDTPHYYVIGITVQKM